MTKIETYFEKLNHYQDIETYYPPLDDIKDFLYELFADRVESQKYIVRTNQKLEQIQSSWNSLREFVEEEMARLATECSHTYEDSLGKAKLVNEDIFNELHKISDRMNELEGKDKE